MKEENPFIQVACKKKKKLLKTSLKSEHLHLNQSVKHRRDHFTWQRKLRLETECDNVSYPLLSLHTSPMSKPQTKTRLES